jgi:hypothetical protein
VQGHITIIFKIIEMTEEILKLLQNHVDGTEEQLKEAHMYAKNAGYAENEDSWSSNPSGLIGFIDGYIQGMENQKLAFLETEEDLQHFGERIKGQIDFFQKVAAALELGNLEDQQHQISDGNKLLLSIIKNETMDTELATTKAALQLEKEPEDRWIAVSEVEIEQLFRDNFDCYADNSTDGADGQIIYGENEPAMTLPVFTKLYKVAMCPFHKPAPLTKDCPHLSSHIDNNGGCYCDTCGKMMEP